MNPSKKIKTSDEDARKHEEFIEKVLADLSNDNKVINVDNDDDDDDDDDDNDDDYVDEDDRNDADQDKASPDQHRKRGRPPKVKKETSHGDAQVIQNEAVITKKVESTEKAESNQSISANNLRNGIIPSAESYYFPLMTSNGPYRREGDSNVLFKRGLYTRFEKNDIFAMREEAWCLKSIPRIVLRSGILSSEHAFPFQAFAGLLLTEKNKSTDLILVDIFSRVNFWSFEDGVNQLIANYRSLVKHLIATRQLYPMCYGLAILLSCRYRTVIRKGTSIMFKGDGITACLNFPNFDFASETFSKQSSLKVIVGATTIFDLSDLTKITAFFTNLALTHNNMLDSESRFVALGFRCPCTAQIYSAMSYCKEFNTVDDIVRNILG